MLLSQLFEAVMSKKKKKKQDELPQVRNFVAKNAQRAGAGAHADKKGKHANRQRQKKQWKKEEGL